MLTINHIPHPEDGQNYNTPHIQPISQIENKRFFLFRRLIFFIGQSSFSDYFLN